MTKYLDRDISWLSFNERVLDEAGRETLPLQDRVMFHSITQSNLAEHLTVRYPAAIQFKAEDELKQLTKAILDHYVLLSKRFSKFNEEHKLIRQFKSLNGDEKNWVDKHFKQNIFPALQPITVDRSRGLQNLRAGLYLLTITEDKKDDTEYVNCIEIPSMLDRFIRIPNKSYCVAIEDVIANYAKYIFKDRKVIENITFVLRRSAENYEQPDENLDPYQLVQATLKQREQAWITYVEVDADHTKKAVKLLRRMLPITSDTIIFGSPMVQLSDIKKIPADIYEEKDRSKKLKIQKTFPNENLFEYIKKEDRLTFHPYESFDASVVKLLQEAAVDENVISIKISLYRVSENSKIIEALLKAADKGKVVTVLIELKARFDEHHNIEVSNILREGGIRLAYTDPNIKTHAKVCLITRKEKKGLRIYSHVGTGNYNESNAKQYTDYSFFTANQEIGYDLTRFFNMMTSNQGTFKSQKIIYAPYNMRESISKYIDKEIHKAKNKQPASIICKCNALTDDKIADKLIAAADAGVKVTLIIRSACILEPRQNMKILSIVGAQLEHSRVYVFGDGKKKTVLIGSSDLMHRNLSLRNELLIKIDSPELKQRILRHLRWYLKDNTNRRIIGKDYSYTLVKTNKKKFTAQEEFGKEAKKLALN